MISNENVILKELLDLYDSGDQSAWVKIEPDDKIEILSSSCTEFKLTPGTILNVNEFIYGDDINRVTQHYKHIETEITTTQFRVSDKDVLRKFHCSSRKIGSDIFSIWRLQSSTEQRSKDILQTTAHDLRSPMNSILGYVNLVQNILKEDEEIDREELGEIMNMIKTSCNYAVDFTTDLLELAQIESDRFQLDTESTLVNYFITSYIKTHQLLTLKKQIKIEFETQFEDHVAVNINGTRITRALDNILSNAIKFSHPGSTITIALTKQKERLAINVIDEGVGMSEDVVKNLFSNFGQAQRIGLGGEKSHGLGMSIVKQIMILHGGDINIKSQEGKGTQVALLLNIDQ